MGLMFGLIYAAYGLAFWYGCKLVMDYRKKEEFMECILKCVADEGDFECFLNCDRFVIIIVCRVPILLLFSGSQLALSRQRSSGSSTVGCKLDNPACTLRPLPRLKLLLFKYFM